MKTCMFQQNRTPHVLEDRTIQPTPTLKNKYRVFSAFFLTHPFMTYFRSTLIYSVPLSEKFSKVNILRKFYPTMKNNL